MWCVGGAVREVIDTMDGLREVEPHGAWLSTHALKSIGYGENGEPPC